MSNLPDVGVRLIAQGEAAFNRAMELAQQKIRGLSKTTTETAAGSSKSSDLLSKSLEGLQQKYLSLVPGGQASIDMLSGFTAELGLSTAATLAAAAAAAALIVGLVALGNRGAALTGLADSFDRLSASAGITAKTLLIDLRKASAGTVSDFDLIRKANLALAGAQGEFGKAFGAALPKLLETARVQAKATGESVDFLFQSLVSGVKRASPRLIDNTGIVLKLAEANEAYAKSIGKTVDQLTEEDKQIAILNATLEAGQRAIDLLGGANETAAEKIARAQSTVTNILDRLALSVQPGFELIMDGVNRVLGAIEKIAGLVGIFLSPIVEIFGTVFSTAIDLVFTILDPLINAIASIGPYLGILFEGIVSVIQGVASVISSVVGGIVNLLKGVAANYFGLDLDNLGPNLFEGAARVFGAFANGIIMAANTLIFPAVIGIATFIADFLVGFSPPKRGPLSKIDQGGANVMTSWLQGLTGVSLDPVEKVAQEVSDQLGSIGKLSGKQVESRIAKLDKALLPFQNRLSIIKSTFDAIAEPAKLALDAIDRQMGKALEALARGDVGSDTTVRRLDAQREAIQRALDAQQGLTDSAQIQLAIAGAAQARERALLAIRKAQIPVMQKHAAIAEKAGGKAPGTPKEEKPKTGGAAPEMAAPGGALDVALPAPEDSVTDLLTGGIEDAKAGIRDAFASQFDTSQLALLQDNTGKLQDQLGRLSGVDLGGALKDKFSTLVDSVFNPDSPGSPAATLKDLLGSITDPGREGSIPYFFNTTLPANIDSATGVVSERVSKLFDSVFNSNTAGSPAQVVASFLDGITNPDTEGSIPYFLGTTLPASIDGVAQDVGDRLRSFFNLFDPNAKDSPAASVKKFVETLFGDSSTEGSIAHFFADLPNQISTALAPLGATLSAAFGLDDPASPFAVIKNTVSTLFADAFTEGSIASFFARLPDDIAIALATFPGLIADILGLDNENSVLFQIKTAVETLTGDKSVTGSVANFFSMIPSRVVDALSNLLPDLQTNVFDPLSNFLMGSGEGTLGGIIDAGVQWFMDLPARILSALQGIGLIVWNSVAVPVIAAVNSLIDIVSQAIGSLARSIAQFIIDNVEGPASSLGITLPQALLDFRAGLMSTIVRIPHISIAAPAFLTAVPAAARGGLFGEGLTRVGDKGEELVASGSSKMGVFPNSFVQALDHLTETLIAQPVAMPLGGGYQDSHDINATFNGVGGSQDVMRRFARLRARS